MNLIPTWAKLAAAGVLLVAAFFFGWVTRGWRADAVDSRAVVSQVQKAADVTQHQQAVTVKVDASATAQAEQTQIVYRTIDREVVRYVDKGTGSNCVLDREWVRLHDEAASGKLSDASGATHAAGTQAGSDR
jgi:hypothetical protein